MSAGSRSADALVWLAEHGDGPDAGVILYDLLERDDLDEISLQKIIAYALAWLSRHGRTRAAQAVLRALIWRYDLDESAGRAVLAVLDWIADNGDAPPVRFFLKTLLDRHDLDDESLARIVRAALGWLEEHGREAGAQFILRALLSRGDLDEPSAQRAITAALGWLELHGTLPEASFVLPALLGRDELDKSSAKRAVLASLAWLEQHGRDDHADFVFIKVLRSRRASPENAGKAARLAVVWLAQAPPERRSELDRTLSALLHRAAVLDDARLGVVLDETLRWIRETRPPADVIGALLLGLQPAARRLGRLKEIRAFAVEAYVGVPATPVSAAAGTRWQAFRRLCEELTARARDAHSRVDPLFVRSALGAARQQLEQGNPGGATFALPGLIPLSLRAGEPALVDEVRALAEALLRGGALSPGQRRGIATSCFRLLEAGAFPDQAEGERVLGELGIERSP